MYVPHKLFKQQTNVSSFKIYFTLENNNFGDSILLIISWLLFSENQKRFVVRCGYIEQNIFFGYALIFAHVAPTQA